MEETKNKKRVGVLRGGDGDHYETSIRQGGEIISHIAENLGDDWKVFDILIDKDNVWHLNGMPVEPAKLSEKVDVVWNASHHSLTNILENLFMPCAGAPAFSGALSESRQMLERHMKEIGIKMPRHILLPKYQPDFDGPKDKYIIKKARAVFEKFGAPWIVKSFIPNRNMGIHLAKTYGELIEAIADGVHHGGSILIEEFILGKVASTHSVSNFRTDLIPRKVLQGHTKDVYVFPLIENLTEGEKEKLTEQAKNIFHHINAENYLQSNFVINPHRGIFLTHISFLPDLKDGSHFHQSCDSVGAKMHHIIEHILNRTYGA